MHDLTIVIPTLNSSGTLGACFTSIENQTYPCKETIVIDRFSADGTSLLARAHGAKVIQANKNRSASRNIGARETNSSGVLFVDSDMILTPTLVEECTNLLEIYDSLIIPEKSVGRGFWAACKQIERDAYVGNDLIEAPRCYRRKPLVAIGGYDENLEAGEDWELRQRSSREGFKMGRTRSMLLHDEGDYTPFIAFRRKYAYGRTINSYVKKNPTATLSQVNPLIRILDPSLKIMSHDLQHGIGVLVLRTLEFAGAGVGFISIRLEKPKENPSLETPDH